MFIGKRKILLTIIENFSAPTFHNKQLISLVQREMNHQIDKRTNNRKKSKLEHTLITFAKKTVKIFTRD